MARWGRGASPVRAGIFIREHLSRVPSDFAENAHRVYKEVFSSKPPGDIPDYVRELRLALTGSYEPPMARPRWKQGSRPYKLCRYQSFKYYFNCLKRLGFIEEVRREKITDRLQFTAGNWANHSEDAPERPVRVYYTLTDKGIAAPDSDWANLQRKRGNHANT